MFSLTKSPDCRCLPDISGLLLGISESRPQESEQDDKWSFCLTAGTLCQRIRRDDEQTTAPEPYTGLQGESGAGRHQGRSNAGPTGGAFRCSSQSDYDIKRNSK